MLLIRFNSPIEDRKLHNQIQIKRNRTIMYEQKQKISIKIKKKPMKRKAQATKKEKQHKIANCIYQKRKSHKTSLNWRCPAIFEVQNTLCWRTWTLGVTKSEINRAHTDDYKHKNNWEKAYKQSSKDSIPGGSLEPQKYGRVWIPVSKRKKWFSKLNRP